MADQSDDHDQEDQTAHDDSPSPMLSGPYAHLFIADIQRQVQQSVDARSKAIKKRKSMSYKPSSSSEIEPPKHEPPANPLPADNLKSCMKKAGKRKGKKAWRKVTWDPDVHDPDPIDLNVDSKGGKSDSSSDVSEAECSKKGERVIKGGKHKEKMDEGEGSNGGKRKEKMDEGSSSKGGKHKEKMDDGSKGGKGKGKNKWEKAKSGKK